VLYRCPMVSGTNLKGKVGTIPPDIARVQPRDRSERSAGTPHGKRAMSPSTRPRAALGLGTSCSCAATPTPRPCATRLRTSRSSARSTGPAEGTSSSLARYSTGTFPTVSRSRPATADDSLHCAAPPRRGLQLPRHHGLPDVGVMLRISRKQELAAAQTTPAVAAVAYTSGTAR
jgi:hypothetical protein